VQPPIDTLLKRKPYENAQASLPSMNSGEPDIPCQKPVTSSFLSADFTRMMSIFGRKFLFTPMTSNSKRSGVVPCIVVSP
jgi:hypothetical protein